MPDINDLALIGVSNNVVIGFAGAMGAGKTCGAEYLQDAYGFGYTRYSQVLAEWIAHPSPTKDVLQSFGWEVMSGERQRDLNERLINRIDDRRSNVVDGLRHPIDFDMLNGRFLNRFFLFFVKAPELVRFDRQKSSGRISDFESFQIADSHQVERPLRELETLAFQIIENTMSLDHYKMLIDNSLLRIRHSIGGFK